MNEKNSIKLILIFAGSLILSALILSDGISSISNSKNIITVTGSAREQITSDYGYFSISINSRAKNSNDAYSNLEMNNKKIMDFFKKFNLTDSNFSHSIISVNAVEKYDKNGSLLNEVDYYSAYQNINIESRDVYLIEKISKSDLRELYNLGVQVTVNQPSYTYSGVQELKISMQAKATLDAKERAIQIAEASDSEIDKLVNARMGVIQIVPRGSTEISDWGMNDISSIQKDIIAVVNVSFNVK
ncbi:MAG: SIMPL domain-containing protein [Candidatus Kapaibacteriota bacterium]|jgi:hypothetical protein